MGVILAQLGHEALGGMARTGILLRAVLLDHGLRHQRNDCTAVWMENRRPQQWGIIRDRTLAMDLVQARVTVKRLRGKIPRAIECQERIAVKQYHLLQCRTALELTNDALERCP